MHDEWVPVTALRSEDPRKIGDWVLSGRLGSGGMGVVYLGQRADQIGAVKRIHAHLADDPGFIRRFKREVELLHRARGERVAKVLDADVQVTPPFLVTEFVAGPTLAEAVGSHGPIQGETLLALAVSLAQAIASIAHAGVTHRDIKPANVILTERTPVVVDFGIATAADLTSITAEGFGVGTAAYMAPEQCEGAVLGPAVDVFAWASVVSFAANGQPPFGEGPTAGEVRRRIIHDPPEHGHLSGRLRRVVEQAHAKTPAMRPSAEGIVADLLGVSRTAELRLDLETERFVNATWRMPIGATDVLDVSSGAGAYHEVQPGVAPDQGPRDPFLPQSPHQASATRRQAPVARSRNAGMRWRRVMVVAGVLVVIALVGRSLVSVLAGRHPTAPTLTAINSCPTGLALGGEALWVPEYLSDSVAQVDRSGSILGAVEVGDSPQGGVGFHNGTVWVTTSLSNSVLGIDPTTMEIRQRIDVGENPRELAIGGDTMWVVNYGGDSVSVVDLTTESAVDEIPIGDAPGGITVTDSAVWVTSGKADDSVSEIDPLSHQVKQTIRVGNDPVGVAVADESVWVANSEDDSVSRVDPSSGTTIATISVSGRPRELLAADEAVWVAQYDGDSVSRIDPATNSVVDTVWFKDSPTGMAGDAEGLWVSWAEDTCSGGLSRVLF
jgi:YVTN family beta-propeller protein